MLIDYLTLNYIFAYFWIAIWLFYQLFIHACSEAKFRKNYFFANFPEFQLFSVKHLDGLGLQSGRKRSSRLLIWQWTAGRVGNMSGRNPYRYFPPLSFSASHTPLHFDWFIMSCCVFISQISLEILAFSAHLFSFHDILRVFLCSFKFLCFSEY
jgi:hypothetical protein